MAYELVVVGVSAGGLQALCAIAGGLNVDFTMAMVIVQHRSKDSYALCDVLQLTVAEALAFFQDVRAEFHRAGLIVAVDVSECRREHVSPQSV